MIVRGSIKLQTNWWSFYLMGCSPAINPVNDVIITNFIKDKRRSPICLASEYNFKYQQKWMLPGHDFTQFWMLQIQHSFIYMNTSGPFYYHGLAFIPAWISNYMSGKVWDEITNPFLNFNGCTVQVSEWISNFTQDFIMDEITYPWWD